MTLTRLGMQCLLCAVMIAGAGYVLWQSADAMAKATWLTGGWIGLALLATVTSLPELASGLSAAHLMSAAFGVVMLGQGHTSYWPFMLLRSAVSATPSSAPSRTPC